MKKDSFYFPHDSNAHDDPKIMILLSEWGLEGYGIYWVLIEHLRNQNNYKAPISILKPLALRFGSSEEKFKTIVTRYNLFNIDKKENFFSLSLIKRMKPLEEKRAFMKKIAVKRWESKRKDDAYALPAHSVSNASKVEEKRKEYIYNKEEIIYDLYGWLKETHYPKLENWNMQHKLDMKLVCDAFIKEKLSEHFNGDNHIINSLKKFIPDFAKNRPDNTGRVILPKVGN